MKAFKQYFSESNQALPEVIWASSKVQNGSETILMLDANKGKYREVWYKFYNNPKWVSANNSSKWWDYITIRSTMKRHNMDVCEMTNEEFEKEWVLETL